MIKDNKFNEKINNLLQKKLYQSITLCHTFLYFNLKKITRVLTRLHQFRPTNTKNGNPRTFTSKEEKM